MWMAMNGSYLYFLSQVQQICVILPKAYLPFGEGRADFYGNASAEEFGKCRKRWFLYETNRTLLYVLTIRSPFIYVRTFDEEEIVMIMYL